MICSKCGCKYDDGAPACPLCGADPINANMQNGYAYQNNGQFAGNGYNNAYNAQYMPMAPAVIDDREKPMTVGDWIVTFLLTSIPVVGIVLLFCWAFGIDEKKSKANYAKATLILGAISVAIGIIIALFTVLLAGNLFRYY